MELFDASGREKRHAFVTALVLALALSVFAVPAVQAAVQAIKGTVAVKDNNTATKANIKSIPQNGFTALEGTTGAIDVRNFAGGAGLLGAGNCAANLNPATAGRHTVQLAGGNVVTTVLITGTDGTVEITSDAAPGIVLLKARVDAGQKNVFVDMGNGLGTSEPLTFTGVPSSTSPGAENCRYVVLGHGPGDTGADNG